MMKMIQEPEREIPVVHEADICVIGGSCTGVFAAARAARLGATVAIVEKQNCFGGAATAGNVNIWHSTRNTTGETPIIAGLTGEVVERLKKRNAVIEGSGIADAYRLNTEELKTELDELVIEHNITPFLHTFYTAPVAKQDRIDAVIIENKNGRQAIRARYFVDASGDADLATDLGLPSQEPEMLQPPSTCAKISGLGSLSGFDWQAAVREHGSEFGLEKDWGWGGVIPGLTDIQLRCDTHVFGIDATDANQLTHAEIEGRRKIRAIMDVIRKYGPRENAIALADLAATIGIRETRRMTAEYRLTGDDLLSGRRFDDAIANGSYPVDIHHSDGPGITIRHLDGKQTTTREHGIPAELGRWRDPLPEDPTFYQVPFRCMIQKRITNLVLSGRMIDTDKIAFSAVRVMVNANQTGEAAGVACVQAMEQGKAICEIDVRALRRELESGGSIVI